MQKLAGNHHAHIGQAVAQRIYHARKGNGGLRTRVNVAQYGQWAPIFRKWFHVQHARKVRGLDAGKRAWFLYSCEFRSRSRHHFLVVAVAVVAPIIAVCRLVVPRLLVTGIRSTAPDRRDLLCSGTRIVPVGRRSSPTTDALKTSCTAYLALPCPLITPTPCSAAQSVNECQ